MTRTSSKTPLALLALILAQALCAAFFFFDVAMDGIELSWPPFVHPHFMIEACAAMALIAAVVFETSYLMGLLRRKAHLEQQVSVAAGALHEVMQDYFQRWQLTPSEIDVATFTIKGLSIQEVAVLRGSAEGTVISHLHAIYRKAGVNGRGALVALFVEDLLDAKPLNPHPDSSPVLAAPAQISLSAPANNGP